MPMRWSTKAEAAIRKVPFFVRKRVRTRVEEEARRRGNDSVSIQDVDAVRQQYLKSMSDEVKGYQIENCFGAGGCPNQAVQTDTLVKNIEKLLKNAGLRDFLKTKVGGDLKFHQEFRVSVADCPNACSQPQIRDIGIIGAAAPIATAEPCSQCGACTDICRETAIRLSGENRPPELDLGRCVRCGRCAAECPTGTLAARIIGYRVQLGGKLGRHPQLGHELPCLLGEEDVLSLVRDCIELFMSRWQPGERFGSLLTHADLDAFRRRYCES